MILRALRKEIKLMKIIEIFLLYKKDVSYIIKNIVTINTVKNRIQ